METFFNRFLQFLGVESFRFLVGVGFEKDKSAS